MVLPPWVTDRVAGVAETEKSATGCGFTTSVTVWVWVKPPLVAVTVRVKVPVGVLAAVLTFSVQEPVGGTLTVHGDAVAPEGNPAVMLTFTVPLNPFCGVTVAV